MRGRVFCGDLIHMTKFPTMLALTIKQPWAHAIATRRKRFENRTWNFAEHLLPMRIAIHAAASEDPRGISFCSQHRVSTNKLTHSAIIAVATVVQFQTESTDLWFKGPIGWQLEDIRRITPIACSGQQGLWMPNDRIQRLLRQQLI